MIFHFFFRCRQLIFLFHCLQIVLYLRMCLAYSAGATPMSARLTDMQDDAPAIGRYIHTLLTSEHQSSVSKVSEANPVHVYMDLLQQLLSAVGGERSYTCPILRAILLYYRINQVIILVIITYSLCLSL